MNWVELTIRDSFLKFGKDISHLSDEEVIYKARLAAKKIEDLSIDVNRNSDEYLKVAFEVFGV